ncbi:4'-phosphopantetheinyl transferase superfamily protein, partial [Sporichthya sp.]|uniref:4'-phosphopantetheinyl transferase superfamily protein n=1 Tax=Sporichthya sp. TaxID=65475 RepID=UPI0017E6632B
PAPGAATPSPAAPVPARTAAGPRSASTSRALSLATDPYLIDHSLLQGPESAGPAASFPIVPMTGTIALIVDAAAALVPERVVIGVRGVRALRPLAVEPEVTLFVEVTEQGSPDGDGLTSVTVVVDGQVAQPDGQSGPRETYARATVLLADAYPARPDLADPPLIAERPPRVDARSLYADRWMFHGPAFRGVTELTTVADNGVRGVVAELEAPGSLLDAAGQLLGYWVARQPHNGLAIPIVIESVDFFGPHPETGAQFATTVWVRFLTDVEVVADLTLRDADGRLWCSITGWTDRRMEGNERTLAAFRHPARVPLTDRQEGGWHLLVEPWSDPAARDIAARQYLSPTEYEQLSGRTPRAARHWLLGRIAAKDAVRDLLWAAGAGRIYPAEIEVGNEASGAPHVSGPGTEGLSVSLAHSGPFAAAIVGRGGSVGIDLELVSDAPAEAALLTPAERDLLDTIAPGTSDAAERAVWVTRFWTAKEAVAKAAGTGLGGRPARFVVTRVENDRLLVVVDGGGRWVTTSSGELPVPFAVGWTQESDMLGPDLGS